MSIISKGIIYPSVSHQVKVSKDIDIIKSIVDVFQCNFWFLVPFWFSIMFIKKYLTSNLIKKVSRLLWSMYFKKERASRNPAPSLSLFITLSSSLFSHASKNFFTPFTSAFFFWNRNAKSGKIANYLRRYNTFGVCLYYQFINSICIRTNYLWSSHFWPLSGHLS